jgi:cytochrome c556
LTLHVFCKSCTVTSPQASNSGSAIAKQHGIALGTMGAIGKGEGRKRRGCALSKLT